MQEIFPPLIQIQTIISNLPGNWATQASTILNVKVGTIRSYARGERGKRNKLFTIELLRTLIEMEKAFQSQFDDLIKYKES